MSLNNELGYAFLSEYIILISQYKEKWIDRSFVCQIEVLWVVLKPVWGLSLNTSTKVRIYH